jgi:hypothetical protein
VEKILRSHHIRRLTAEEIVAQLKAPPLQLARERSYSGVAPITRRGGKRCVVVMRQSCSERLRNAVYHWSRVSAQCDDAVASIMRNFARKGKTHGRALRGVADRLLAVLVAMLKTGPLYDPQFRNTSAQRAEQLVAS